MYQYIEHAHLIYLHLSPISSRTYVGLCGSFPLRMAMDLGFVAADVLRPAHTPRAQRLVLDSVFVCACDNMNCMCIYIIWVCQGYSPNNFDGDRYDDPLELDISYFQTNQCGYIIIYIYVGEREREKKERKKEQKKTREKTKKRKEEGGCWRSLPPSIRFH